MSALAANPAKSPPRRKVLLVLAAMLIIGVTGGVVWNRYAMPSILVGAAAPDFTAVTQSGESIRLADYQGREVVVLYFYPKDNTPGCTVQACSFRDAYEEFVKAGAVVIGVSSDTADSHRKFADNERLPFLLVADSGGAIRNAYGIPRTFGIFPGRVTFVIDRKGIVRLVFNSQFSPTQHVTEALEVVRQLAKEYRPAAS